MTNLGALLMPKEKFKEFLEQKEAKQEVVNTIPEKTEQTAFLLKPKKGTDSD